MLLRLIQCSDLYCDVIGTMKTVAWSFHGRKIAGTGGTAVFNNDNNLKDF